MLLVVCPYHIQHGPIDAKSKAKITATKVENFCGRRLLFLLLLKQIWLTHQTAGACRQKLRAQRMLRSNNLDRAMQQTVQPAQVRLDKWLWAVRVFKTRSLAADACRAGHVKIGGQPVKPAHGVKVGEIITAQVGPITRTVKALGLIEQRVCAKTAALYMEDLTPPEEYKKRREPEAAPLVVWPKGQGRPTKKDRRLLGGLSFEQQEPL